MAYENRNGRQYYYRKKREGNRVISEYIGNGEAAALLSQLDEIDRYEKAVEAEEMRKKRETEAKIDCELLRLESEIKKLTETFLISSGFYKTKSREWRIRKNEYENSN